MNNNNRLRIAIQKKGRLNVESANLLKQCGLHFSPTEHELISPCQHFDIDLLFVRDDDIPAMVMDNACDLGFVGQNVLFEKSLSRQSKKQPHAYRSLLDCDFGRCRLSLALPVEQKGPLGSGLQNAVIATSYPFLLRRYLKEQRITANIVEIAGSVELMPRLGMADAICDLVSSGRTLEENKLSERAVVLDSQACLIQSTAPLSSEKERLIALLLRRLQSAIKAKSSKYIVFHAPLKSLPDITSVLPGVESPTVVPLDAQPGKVAVQLVSAEAVFWDTLETIKDLGASSILVLPIDKMMR